MKKYKIESSHVVETSVIELEEVNSFGLQGEVEAKNVEQAIRSYIKNVLHYDDTDLVKDEILGWHLYTVVDRNNYQASEKQIKGWREGKIQLYFNHSYFTVYEMVLVNNFEIR